MGFPGKHSEWVTISSFRGSSQPRAGTKRLLHYHWAAWKAWNWIYLRAKQQEKGACRTPAAIAATHDATSTAAAISTVMGMPLYYWRGAKRNKRSFFPRVLIPSPLAHERGLFMQLFLLTLVESQDSGGPRIYAWKYGRREEAGSHLHKCCSLRLLFSSSVNSPLYTFQSPQIVDLCILSRTFSCNQWERVHPFTPCYPELKFFNLIVFDIILL